MYIHVNVQVQCTWKICTCLCIDYIYMFVYIIVFVDGALKLKMFINKLTSTTQHHTVYINILPGCSTLPCPTGLPVLHVW